MKSQGAGSVSKQGQTHFKILKILLIQNALQCCCIPIDFAILFVYVCCAVTALLPSRRETCSPPSVSSEPPLCKGRTPLAICQQTRRKQTRKKVNLQPPFLNLIDRAYVAFKILLKTMKLVEFHLHRD